MPRLARSCAPSVLTDTHTLWGSRQSHATLLDYLAGDQADEAVIARLIESAPGTGETDAVSVWPPPSRWLLHEHDPPRDPPPPLSEPTVPCARVQEGRTALHIAAHLGVAPRFLKRLVEIDSGDAGLIDNVRCTLAARQHRTAARLTVTMLSPHRMSACHCTAHVPASHRP